MTTSAKKLYKGVFPVAPTVFDADGRLDLEGQKRAIDFMIDAGSHGVCILANFSEQFVLTDDERDLVMTTVLEHVAGRIPVIVTTTHFSTFICAERSRRAQEKGAAMVMVMPPYHGATFRVPEGAIYDFYRGVSDAISIPIMVQDAPVAGTPLSVALLARMAKEIENLAYFKIEVPRAADKLRALIEAGGAAIDGLDRILDVPPASMHARTPLIFGSRDKVERVARYYAEGSDTRIAPLFARRGLLRH